MSLKICCKNCVHLSFLKKIIIKKIIKKNVEWNCGNGIAENKRKKNKIMVAEIWGGIIKKLLRPQYFYNIFTINHR